MDAPTFRWEPAEGARRYRLQVATDENFTQTTLLEDVTTNSTGYTAKTTYPSGTLVHWRVRGEDEQGVAMSWSEPPGVARSGGQGRSSSSFRRRCPLRRIPVAGDFVPTIVLGIGSGRGVLLARNPAASPAWRRCCPPRLRPATPPRRSSVSGSWKWRVRANFPGGTTVSGPFTEWRSFTRGLPAPSGANTALSERHVVFHWQPPEGPGNGVKEYRVQTSTRPDFSTLIENDLTENTNYAPLLTSFAYAPGVTFYWRVASVDGGLTTGAFTAARTFTAPANAAPPPPPPPRRSSRLLLRRPLLLRLRLRQFCFRLGLCRLRLQRCRLFRSASCRTSRPGLSCSRA